MSEEKNVYNYPGERATVKWDRRLCIHVGECGRATGDLFVGGRNPWCQPDQASPDEIEQVVERCPTGALTVETGADGGSPMTAAATNTIVVANNGPLYARGELQIDGRAADMDGVSFRAALCRCGQSKRKPFCDNSHESSGFCDRGAIGPDGDGLESEGGPLAVRRAKNGPLLVSGNLSLVTGAGRVAWRGTKAALCRCGHSANKPFCDGAHKAAGFEAD